MNFKVAGSRHSRLREKIVEHEFIAALLQRLWRAGRFDVELATPQVDNGGADLVISRNEIVRHVQLKATDIDSRPKPHKVNMALSRKPSGCAIWIQIDPEILALRNFHWFGGLPGERLPDISNLDPAKHTKGNKEGDKLNRSEIKLVPASEFEPGPSKNGIDWIARKLFGTDILE